MSNGKTFQYHAHGAALGGVFRRPQVVLDSQASASLAVTGGHASAAKPGFGLPDLVSFTNASTDVNGRQKPDGSYETTIVSTIDGLTVTDRVTVDHITAQLTSVHTSDDSEAQVTAAGSTISGFKVDGKQFDPVLDVALFSTLDTCAKFKDKYQQDAAFKQDMRSRFLWGTLPDDAPDFLKTRYKWQTDPSAQPESKGIMPCSLVKSVGNASAGLKVYGNVIIVPNFGKIYLAEFYMKDGFRRLNMMRFELGSPVEGDVTVCGIEGNGQSFP